MAVGQSKTQMTQKYMLIIQLSVYQIQANLSLCFQAVYVTLKMIILLYISLTTNQMQTNLILHPNKNIKKWAI